MNVGLSARLPFLTPVSAKEEAALRAAEELACDLAGSAPADTNGFLEALKATDIYGLRIPPAQGGVSSQGLAHLYANEFLSRHAAPATFLLQQHNRVAVLLSRAPGSRLRDDALLGLARGQYLGAIGASHLRKRGTRALTATKVGGGYVFDGSTPWVSGAGIATHVLLGGVVPGEPPAFAWLPFAAADGLTVSPRLDLWVMQETGTVSIHCADFFVPDERILSRDETGMFSNNGTALSTAAAFPLGLTARCLESMRDWAARSSAPQLAFAGEELYGRFCGLRADFYQVHQANASAPPSPSDWARAFALRGAVSELALAAALAGMVLVGGQSQMLDHAANRALREASFYVTTTVTDEIKEVLLRSLLGEQPAAVLDRAVRLNRPSLPAGRPVAGLGAI